MSVLSLSHRMPPDWTANVHDQLALTAEERSRSRHRFITVSGQSVHLNLPRGTVLQDGDILATSLDDSDTICIRVVARPEPVLTVTATTPLLLLQAAYHLGNRHVSLEITSSWLRLSPDSVLEAMLRQLGLFITTEVAPFNPEVGAYHHSVHHQSHHSGTR